MNVTFSSRGTNYTATPQDIFMENGISRMFIKGGKNASFSVNNVLLSAKEWQRIKDSLVPIDYEKYYGRKPLVQGVIIYQVKQ